MEIQKADYLRTTFINPVLGRNFPDPFILATEQGYYAYATQNHCACRNIQLAFSPDLVHWEMLSGGALSALPTWAQTAQDVWSPDVSKVGNEYRLYYSIDPDSHDGMRLALAKSATPISFLDVGKPITPNTCSSFCSIDPCFFLDPKSGRNFLYWGSHHRPIQVQELSEDGHTFAKRSFRRNIIYPRNSPGEWLVEGVFVEYISGLDKYFAYVSGDDTRRCYQITAYEATNPLGPFTRIGPVLTSNQRWRAPGQNCIICDAMGQRWMVYHAIDKYQPFLTGSKEPRRVMCMDRVTYDKGFPEIENGSPSISEKPGPVVLRLGIGKQNPVTGAEKMIA